MLFYAETGVKFTNDFGDIEEKDEPIDLGVLLND